MQEESNFSVSGKRVLVTGGTAGIGLGVARAFTGAGARVVISGRRDNGPDIAAQAGAGFVKMDVASQGSVAEATAAAAGLLGGGIDVLVANAGITPPSRKIGKLDYHEMRDTFAVNVFGVIYTVQEALSYMGEGGSVIVTSSPAATVFMPGISLYSASKATVDALVQTWALEMGPRGIRVNAVLPGVVETELAFDPAHLQEELEMLSHFTANGKYRQPEEIAPVYLFLACAASTTMSGALLAADDGISAGLSSDLQAAIHG